MRGLVIVGLVLGLLMSASGSGLAARGDPKMRITPADQKRARVMVVRRSDVAASFKKGRPSSESDFYCRSDDESDLTVTGDADGPDWVRSPAFGLYTVVSGSSVYESARDATKSWKRATRQATQRCFGNQYRHEFGNQFPQSTLTLHRRSFPRVAQRTFEYRFTLLVDRGRGKVFADFVFLKQSRALASVGFFSIRRPPTRAYETRLAHVVARRLRSAMRGA